VKTECVTPRAQTTTTTGRKKRRYRTTVKPHPKTEITLAQQRFFVDGGTDSSNQLWLIPVCIKTDDNKPFCQLLGDRQQIVPVVSCSNWVFTNSNAVGYYRTEYDAEMLKKLGDTAMTGLTTAERMSLINDQSALVRAGKEKVGSLLDLVAALSTDQERAVVETYRPALNFIDDYLVSAGNREAYHAWLRSTFHPMLAKLGWTPGAGETDDTRTLRADLVDLLSMAGEDPETIKESIKLARQYLQDPNSVDATLAPSVLGAAARGGDAALLDEYLAGMQRMKSPEQYYNIGQALSEFRGPSLVERVLQLAVSAEVRNQDAPHLIAAVLANASSRDFAWQWIKGHWPEVEKKITMSSGGDIVGATRSFCDGEHRDEVQKFFSEHKVAASERALKQVAEGINSCISYRERQQGNLATWLGQHPGTAVAGKGQ